MDASTLWWLLAGAVVGIELLTGTFYLLMLALGPVVGAVSAYAGLPVNGQIIAAALVGAGAVAACHQWRKKRLGDASVGADRSVNLDIGETVQIDHWNPDGTAFRFEREVAIGVEHQLDALTQLFVAQEQGVGGGSGFHAVFIERARCVDTPRGPMLRRDAFS